MLKITTEFRESNPVKVVVSSQDKYLDQIRENEKVILSDEIGEVEGTIERSYNNPYERRIVWIKW
jgi:ribosomal protein S4E